MFVFIEKIILLCVLVVFIADTSVGNNSHVMKINRTKTDNTYGNREGENDALIDFHVVIKADVLEKVKDRACMRDLKAFFRALFLQEKWPLKFLDASAKLPVGFLYGAHYQLGNFDQCVEAQQAWGPHRIKGQYCLADVDIVGEAINSAHMYQRRTQFDNVLHWAVCVPSSCPPHDVQTLVQAIITGAIGRSYRVTVKVDDDKCHYDRPSPLQPIEIVYGCTIGVFLVFTVLATGFHYYLMQQHTKHVPYNVEAARARHGGTLSATIVSFSLIKTVGNFLRTKPSDLNLECICGIKFISMLLIVAGHSIIFTAGGPITHVDFYNQALSEIRNGIFVNNPLLVDTFLLIGAFLLCHLLLIELDKRKGKINVIILYLARYIRLTPSYLAVIGLYCSFLLRLGSGPLWDSRITLEQDRCRNSWWTNILYINNYVNTENLCMFQSWYLAVDFHLFIIAPFLIYPVWKWPMVGNTILGVCTFICIFIPFWISYINKLDPTIMAYAPEISDLSTNYYFINAYIKTHMRASSYCLGLIFGFIVYKLRTSGSKLPKIFVQLGWLVATMFGAFSMFTVTAFYRLGHDYNPVEAASYAAAHRVGWCIFVGWIVTVCITDNATLVNKFLSWKPFVPLSRLTYSTYLVNGLVEIYSLGTTRVVENLGYYDLAVKSISHIVFSFALAFFVCILFESPIHGLEKILLRKHDSKTKLNGKIPMQTS